jgi:putative hydrolase of the HAD superfamily
VQTGVLFDLDGTLIDHDAAARTALIASFTSGTVADPDGWSEDEVAAEWRRLERQHFGAYVAGTVTFEEQRRSRLRGLLTYMGRPLLPDAALDELFASYLVNYEQAWSPYADVEPVLVRLHEAGVRLGVLTNGQEEQQLAKLRATGLVAYMHCVVASSALREAKPARGAFRGACDRLGTTASCTFYVGDDVTADAIAASAAGLKGIWLNRQSHPCAAPPPLIINNMTELLPLVLGNTESRRAAGPVPLPAKP